MKSRLTVAAAIAITAALAIAQEAVELKWKPKVGLVAEYAMVIKPEVPGMEIEARMTLTDKIIEIKANGEVVLEESMGGMVLLMNGQEQQMGDVGTQTMTFSSSGELLSVTGTGEMTNARLSESLVLTYPVGPIKPGESWKRSKKGDPAKGTFDCETSYTFVGKETVGNWACNKVKMEFKELTGQNPISMTGTVWLSAADGMLCKAESSMKNVEFQPGMPMNAVAKLERVK